MITRPLELMRHLRPPPRTMDSLYFVNLGLIGLFFVVFGSRFVLAPGLRIDLPQIAGAVGHAATTNVVINVPSSDVAIVDSAVLRFNRLGDWLHRKAEAEPGAALLIRADASVPLHEVMRLYDLALAAGFARVQLAAESPAEPAPQGAAGGPEAR